MRIASTRQQLILILANTANTKVASSQLSNTNTRASFATQLLFSSFLLVFAAPRKAIFQQTQIQIPKITEQQEQHHIQRLCVYVCVLCLLCAAVCCCASFFSVSTADSQIILDCFLTLEIVVLLLLSVDTYNSSKGTIRQSMGNIFVVRFKSATFIMNT